MDELLKVFGDDTNEVKKEVKGTTDNAVTTQVETSAPTELIVEPSVVPTNNIFGGLVAESIKVESNDFDDLPEGDYPVTAENLRIRTTAKGGVMANIQFRVVGSEKYNNRVIFWPFWFKTDGTQEQLLSSVGRFANAVGTTIYGINIDDDKKSQVKQGVVNLLQEFEKNNGKDLVFDKWFTDSRGELSIKMKPDPNSDRVWTNYKFTKSA